MKIIGLLICLVALSCSKPSESTYEPPTESDKTGKELAEIYCASCHNYASPTALPKAIWEKNILPKMAIYMGLQDAMGELMKLPEKEMLETMNNNVYVPNPMIHANDWEKIKKYILEQAPDSLKVSESNFKADLGIFKIENTYKNAQEVVSTRFIDSKLYATSADLDEIVEVGSKNKISKVSAGKDILDLVKHPVHGLLMLECVNMNPNDQKIGSLKTISGKVLISELRRPVSVEILDINQDNFDDFIIASFGNHMGDLAWYDGKTFQKTELINGPGARNVEIVDFDKDGKKDILVLMTQAKESIRLLKNAGLGKFESTTLLSFPPYFGSSFFEAKDVDNDLDLDLILSFGDNADLSIVKKPFHGVKIFKNNGKNQLLESDFFAFQGTTKTQSADFDLDGDLDIAASSFFPDSRNSFMYLENQDGKYAPKTIKSLGNTKWLTQIAIDIDNDTDMDLVLGAFNRNNLKSKTGVFILKNQTKK
jgi:hypothetical protein